MIQVNHQLLLGDFQRQIDFCTWLFEKLKAFLRFLAIGDKAAFQINGTVTTRNVRCYALKHHSPLKYAFSKSMSKEQLLLWIGLCRNKELIEPFFFKSNINNKAYLQTLNNQIIPALVEHYVLQANVTFLRVWWAQDRVPLIAG